MANTEIVKFRTYDRLCPVCGSCRNEFLYANPDYKYIDAAGTVYAAPLRYVICEDCAHVFKNPNMDQEQFGELYQKCFIEYFGRFKELNLRDSGHFECFCRLMDDFFSAVDAPVSVLEIGCGSGALLNSIYERYGTKISRLKGIDPSVSLGEVLRGNKIFQFENVFFKDFDKTEKYDLIILDNVFEHFDSPNKELADLKIIMKDSGNLYISLPDISKPENGFVDMFAGHPSNYAFENFEFLMKRAGFCIERFEYHIKWLNCLVALKEYPDVSAMVDFSTIKRALGEKIKNHFSAQKALLRRLRAIIGEHVDRLHRQNKQMLIFGAGCHTQELLIEVDFKNTVGGLIDSSPSYHGKTRLGLPVYSPDDLSRLSFDKILLSSHSFEKDMEKKLLNLGVPAEKIISLYE